MQRLSELAEALGARCSGVDVTPVGAAIDTRKLRPGELFVALPGQHVDGHDFVAAAAARGAAAALVARPVPVELPQLIVADVLVAMQGLAALWRQRWGGKLVGVTGSNGKTSVKEMLSAILGQQHTVYATPGNLNNHIGLPLCLLNLRPEDQFAVLEMGASKAGDIALLAALARPDVGVITMAGDAHLEGFGSRRGVALAKGELFAALPVQGVAVINVDDEQAQEWRRLAAGRKMLGFGRASAADVRACKERNELLSQHFELQTPAGAWRVDLPMPGRHSVMNALAAAAVATALGLDGEEIQAGLAQMHPVAGRLQVRQMPGGQQLIDDSYNANPHSLQVALELLAQCPPSRHLVLGDMAELGAQAPQLHAQAGAAIRRAGIEHLWTVGSLSRHAAEAYGPEAQHFSNRESLQRALSGSLSSGDSVLVKGSRSAGMDQLVAQLLESSSP